MVAGGDGSQGPRVMNGGLHTSAPPELSACSLTHLLLDWPLFNPEKSPFLLNIYSHLLPNFGDSYVLSAAAVVSVPCISSSGSSSLTQVLAASPFGRPGAFKPMGRGFGNLALTDSSIECPRSLQVQEGWTYTLGPQRYNVSPGGKTVPNAAEYLNVLQRFCFGDIPIMKTYPFSGGKKWPGY